MSLDAKRFYSLHGKGQGKLGRSLKEEQTVAYRMLLRPDTVTPAGSSVRAVERRATAVDGLTTAVVRTLIAVARAVICPHARTAQHARLRSPEQHAVSRRLLACVRGVATLHVLRGAAWTCCFEKAQVRRSWLQLTRMTATKLAHRLCCSSRSCLCGLPTAMRQHHRVACEAFDLHELHALHGARSLEVFMLC